MWNKICSTDDFSISVSNSALFQRLKKWQAPLRHRVLFYRSITVISAFISKFMILLHISLFNVDLVLATSVATSLALCHLSPLKTTIRSAPWDLSPWIDWVATPVFLISPFANSSANLVLVRVNIKYLLPSFFEPINTIRARFLRSFYSTRK